MSETWRPETQAHEAAWATLVARHPDREGILYARVAMLLPRFQHVEDPLMAALELAAQVEAELEVGRVLSAGFATGTVRVDASGSDGRSREREE
jgi:hypothetical protein